jgi:hypothetical protein
MVTSRFSVACRLDSAEVELYCVGTADAMPANRAMVEVMGFFIAVM